MSESSNVTTSANTNTLTEPNPNAELRAYADRLKDENAELRREVVSMRLESIGLNPKEGLGKAIAKEYDGEYSLEAVRGYAKEEYGYEPKEPSVEPSIVTDAQHRIDDLMAEGTSVTPQQETDPVEDAEAKLASDDATTADARTSMSTKLQAFMSQQQR